MKINLDLFANGVEYHNLEFTENLSQNCFNIPDYPFESVLNPAKKKCGLFVCSLVCEGFCKFIYAFKKCG